MIRLLYIGKSNKRFTHDRLYTWFGNYNYLYSDIPLFVTVITNTGVQVYFHDDHYNYFYDNFRFIDEVEYTKYIRKKKLKALSFFTRR